MKLLLCHSHVLKELGMLEESFYIQSFLCVINQVPRLSARDDRPKRIGKNKFADGKFNHVLFATGKYKKMSCNSVAICHWQNHIL